MKAWVLRQPFWSFYILAVLLSIFANTWMFGFEPNIGQVLNDTQEALGLSHFSVLVPLSLMLSHPLLLPSFLFPSAPAVSAIVVSGIQGGGETYRATLGAARGDGDEPMRPDHQFHIASIGKTMGATQELAAGADAADCQPAFKNWVPWDPERPDDPQAGIVNYYLNQLAHAPVGPPGEQYHYSDTAYVILGLVIERLTGQSLHPQLPSGSSTRWHALPGIADPTVGFGLGIYNNHYPSGIEIRGHGGAWGEMMFYEPASDTYISSTVNQVIGVPPFWQETLFQALRSG